MIGVNDVGGNGGPPRKRLTSISTSACSFVIGGPLLLAAFSVRNGRDGMVRMPPSAEPPRAPGRPAVVEAAALFPINVTPPPGAAPFGEITVGDEACGL